MTETSPRAASSTNSAAVSNACRATGPGHSLAGAFALGASGWPCTSCALGSQMRGWRLLRHRKLVRFSLVMLVTIPIKHEDPDGR